MARGELPGDSDMIAVWHSMSELYGHLWLANYGEATETYRDKSGEEVTRLSSTLETWRKTLRGISRQELADGISECIRRGDDRVPTAPQFRQRCLSKRRGPARAGPALPPPPRDREAGRQALQEIREILGRRGARGRDHHGNGQNQDQEAAYSGQTASS